MITEVFLYVGQPLLRAFCAECRALIHLLSHATLSRDQHAKEVYAMIFFFPHVCVRVCACAFSIRLRNSCFPAFFAFPLFPSKISSHAVQ